MSLHACLWRRAACRQRRSLNSDASFQGRCLCLRPWTGRADDGRFLDHRGDVGNTKPSPRPTHRQGLMVPQPGNARGHARVVDSFISRKDEYEQARAQKCKACRSQGEKSARNDILIPHTPPPAPDARPN
jgi:hypothetical protein